MILVHVSQLMLRLSCKYAAVYFQIFSQSYKYRTCRLCLVHSVYISYWYLCFFFLHSLLFHRALVLSKQDLLVTKFQNITFPTCKYMKRTLIKNYEVGYCHPTTPSPWWCSLLNLNMIILHIGVWDLFFFFFFCCCCCFLGGAHFLHILPKSH